MFNGSDITSQYRRVLCDFIDNVNNTCLAWFRYDQIKSYMLKGSILFEAIQFSESNLSKTKGWDIISLN